MNREEAFRSLDEGNPRERLEGARFLAKSASPEEVDRLQRLLAAETVAWVRDALEKALSRAVGIEVRRPHTAEELFPDVNPDIVEEIRQKAVADTTSGIVHELDRIVGLAKYWAASEVEAYEESRTKRYLTLIQELLAGIVSLAKSTDPNRPDVEVNLLDFLEEIAEEASQSHPGGPKIELVAKEETILSTDPVLLRLVVANGLKNAVEATVELARDKDPSVLVDWGIGESDLWIVIQDRGKGLPPRSEQIFNFGTSTKEGHVGAGLAIADQAARTLGGRISLSPRDGGGGIFEFKCPKERVL